MRTVSRREQLSAHTLGADELKRLLDLLRADSRINQAWVLARETTERGDRPHIIILAIAVPFFGAHAPTFRQRVIDEYTLGVDFLSEPATVFQRGVGWLDRMAATIDNACVYTKGRRA